MDELASEILSSLQRMGENFLALSPKIFIGIIVFFVFYFVGKLMRHWIRVLSSRSHKHRNIGLVLGRMSQFLVVFLGVFVALTIIFPSIKASTLVQFFGISSVAIGFAFKDILQNFLAGILILLTEPFKINDQIRVKDFEGTVDDIQTRATYIKTYDGKRVVIPNSVLFTESVTVNTAFPSRRNECLIGVGFGDDIYSAEKLILEAIHSISDVVKNPPPDVIVSELGASSVNIRARWWSKPEIKDVLQVQNQVIAAIRNKLGENGIDLPFPTTQVLFHDQTEITDGDRRKQREGWPAGKSPPLSRFQIDHQLAEEKA